MNTCADFKGWFPLRFESWLMAMATTTPTTGKNYGIQPMGQRPISNQAPAWKSSTNPSTSGQPHGITTFSQTIPDSNHTTCVEFLWITSWPSSDGLQHIVFACFRWGSSSPRPQGKLMWDGHFLHWSHHCRCLLSPPISCGWTYPLVNWKITFFNGKTGKLTINGHVP